MLAGGSGKDVFVFEKLGPRSDRGFRRSDRIDLSDFNFKSYTSLKSHFDQTKSGVLIDFGSDDALFVSDVKIADLDRGAFIL